MKRLVWLPLAGFLLITGAAVAAAAPTIGQPGTWGVGSLGDSDAEVGEVRFGPADLLEDVLADLVVAGTISQEQADAVVAALASELEARRAAFEEQRELMLGFIEDGVITQAEIDQLPAESPLREVWNGIARDGQVTLEQLREFGPFGGRGPGHRHGH